jgi:hypothetical protein
MLDEIWQFILGIFKTPLLRGYAFVFLIGGIVGLWAVIRSTARGDESDYPGGISPADRVNKIHESPEDPPDDAAR